jgi:hypothetical protein
LSARQHTEAELPSNFFVPHPTLKTRHITDMIRAKKLKVEDLHVEGEKDGITQDLQFNNIFCPTQPLKVATRIQRWITDEPYRVRQTVDRLIENQKSLADPGMPAEVINIIETASSPENFYVQYLAERSRVEKDLLAYITRALCDRDNLEKDLPYFGPQFVDFIWNMDSSVKVPLYANKEDDLVVKHPEWFKELSPEELQTNGDNAGNYVRYAYSLDPSTVQTESKPGTERQEADTIEETIPAAKAVVPPSAEDMAIQFDISPEFPPLATSYLRTELNKFRGRVFTNRLGLTHLMQHTVELVDGALPFHSYPYRLAPQKAAALEHIVKQYVKQGLLEPCRSDFVSQAFIVGKKGAKSLDDWRLVVDYKKLNKISKKLIFPHPDREAAIQSMHGMRFVTIIDISKAFHQIALTRNSVATTALITPSGIYGNLRMPMGITNGPAVQQMLMNKIFADLVGHGVAVYIDDIIIYTKRSPAGTDESDARLHADKAIEVVRRLEDAGLTTTGGKCKFGRIEAPFLGFIVTRDGLKPDPAKVEAITKLVSPMNKTMLMAALGMMNFCSRFVPEFARFVAELTPLLCLGVPFEWKSEHEVAFQRMKTLFSVDLMLHYPDWSKPMFLITDASKRAIGGFITQDPTNYSNILAYYSRTLSSVEQRWTTTEKELLPIVEMTEKFRYLLLGHDDGYFVKTDHQALVWLRELKNPTDKLLRWQAKLQAEPMTIVYIKGKDNILADSLSRYYADFEEGDIIEKFHASEIGRPGLAADNEWYHDDLSAVPVNVICSHTDFTEFISTIEDDEDAIEHLITCSAVTNMPTYGSRSRHRRVQENFDALKAHVPERKSEFILQQKNDKHFGPLYLEVEAGTADPVKLEFVICDGVLYRAIGLYGELRDMTLALCLPANLVEYEIRSAHLATDHGGYLPTADVLISRFYWPGMVKEAKAYLKRCELCQKIKKDHVAKAGLIMARRRPSFKLVHWSLDFMGGYSTTSNQNKHILVMTELATKYIVISPSKVADSAVVKSALETRLFCYFGIPESVLTDNGSEFTSAEFKYFLDIYGIEHVLIPSHHPQGNPTERSNQEVKRKLRFYTDKAQNHWDRALPHIMSVLNSLPNSTTGFSPHELAFGVKPRSPRDREWSKLLGEQSLSIEEMEQEAIATVGDAALKLRVANRIAVDHQDKQADYFNASKREVSFAIGDTVWKSAFHLSSKIKGFTASLAPPKEGPFEIVERPGYNRYKLKNLQTGRAVKGEWHVSKLRAHIAPTNAEDSLFKPKLTVKKSKAKPKGNTSASRKDRSPSPILSSDDSLSDSSDRQRCQRITRSKTKQLAKKQK